MTSPNVDLVRSIFSAWEQGDFGSANRADPEVEYVIADGPDPGRWSGLAGVAEGFRSFLRSLADFRASADEYRQLDDERVLVLGRFSGRGKTSGLDVERMRMKTALVFHVRAGKVTRLVHYWDRDRALADLGLAPDGEA